MNNQSLVLTGGTNTNTNTISTTNTTNTISTTNTTNTTNTTTISTNTNTNTTINCNDKNLNSNSNSSTNIMIDHDQNTNLKNTNLKNSLKFYSNHSTSDTTILSSSDSTILPQSLIYFDHRDQNTNTIQSQYSSGPSLQYMQSSSHSIQSTPQYGLHDQLTSTYSSLNSAHSTSSVTSPINPVPSRFLSALTGNQTSNATQSSSITPIHGSTCMNATSSNKTHTMTKPTATLSNSFLHQSQKPLQYHNQYASTAFDYSSIPHDQNAYSFDHGATPTSSTTAATATHPSYSSSSAAALGGYESSNYPYDNNSFHSQAFSSSGFQSQSQSQSHTPLANSHEYPHEYQPFSHSSSQNLLANPTTSSPYFGATGGLNQQSYLQHQQQQSLSNLYHFNKDTSINSSSSFGYTPPFSRLSSASLLSLENHFSSTSFFGGLSDGAIERPTTPPDSSISFDGPLDANMTSSISSVSTLPISHANPPSFLLSSSTTAKGLNSSGNSNILGLSSNASDRPEAMRTLYFGNLPPDLPISDFLNYVRGGILEECKYLQQKNCVFVTFLEASVAASVYLEYQQNPFSIEGYECRVGWGKPSTLHPSIRNHVLKGATRNVFLGNLDPEISREDLEQEFSQFGMVDCVKVLPEKRIGFVHLCSVSAAIKAVASLSQLASLPSPSSDCELDSQHQVGEGKGMNHGLTRWKWGDTRVYYGKDRCCTQPPPPPSTSPSLPEENRTVYIGGIHADVTTKDLCDVIRGGLLQQIKYFPEKNICFATFISAASAASFYARATSEGLVLRSKRMKIGWGKPSMLPISIANAVEKGASRNVYIGSIDMEGSTHGGNVMNDTSVLNATKEALYSYFEEFGEIELVNIVAEKRIGFVCFTDIVSAMKAVEAMRASHGSEGSCNGSGGKEASGLFRRVNFGKDRCANAFRPPKSSVSPPPSPE